MKIIANRIVQSGRALQSDEKAKNYWRHSSQFTPRRIRGEILWVNLETFLGFEECKVFSLGRCIIDGDMGKTVVEARGFEPLTPASRTQCATGLRYASIHTYKY